MSSQSLPLPSKACSNDFSQSHTTTETGLKISSELNTNTYQKGIVVTKAEFDALNLSREDFHGEWNYTLSPIAQTS